MDTKTKYLCIVICPKSVKSSSSMFTGKESIVLKPLPAVVVLSYFTASEKENLRTERKQNYIIKNEKEKKVL